VNVEKVIKLLADEVFLNSFVFEYIKERRDWSKLTEKFKIREEDLSLAISINPETRRNFQNCICEQSLNSATEALPVAIASLEDIFGDFGSDAEIRMKAVAQLITIFKALSPKQSVKKIEEDPLDNEIEEIYKGLRNGAE
jgi:hypothetical protein